MIGNYNFADGMYINYDNGCMNPAYGSSMMTGAAAPAQSYFPLPGGCPLMAGQGMNMLPPMRTACPMMYQGMQYQPAAAQGPAYGAYNYYNNENHIAPMNPGMVSIRPVSIQEIQD